VFFSCSRKKHIILIRKTLTPTSEQLNLLPLRPGANTITFRAGGAADLTAYVYLLRWNTRLVSEGGGMGRMSGQGVKEGCSTFLAAHRLPTGLAMHMYACAW
jgi:hypothetical protein